MLESQNENKRQMLHEALMQLRLCINATSSCCLSPTAGKHPSQGQDWQGNLNKIHRFYPLKLCLPKPEHASMSLDLCVENQILKSHSRPTKSKLQGLLTAIVAVMLPESAAFYLMGLSGCAFTTWRSQNLFFIYKSMYNDQNRRTKEGTLWEHLYFLNLFLWRILNIYKDRQNNEPMHASPRFSNSYDQA